MRPDGPIAEFEIDPEPIWPADDARLEPLFFAAPLWLEFDEPGMDGPLLPDWPPQEPLLVAFDPEASLVAEPVERDAHVSARADPRAERLGSWLGSLGVHLLPVLLLVAIAPRSAGAPGSAIPVRLLVMQAPISEPNQSTPQLAASALPPPQSAPQLLPTSPSPPPPRPQRHASIAPHQPQKPSPRQEAPAEHHAAEPAKATSPHQATDAVTQPAAMTRDQYLAYLVNLTWRHVDMLPESFYRRTAKASTRPADPGNERWNDRKHRCCAKVRLSGDRYEDRADRDGDRPLPAAAIDIQWPQCGTRYGAAVPTGLKGAALTPGVPNPKFAPYQGPGSGRIRVRDLKFATETATMIDAKPF